MREKKLTNGIFSQQEQIKTHTYKEQAYELIKDAILYQKFRLDTVYSQEELCGQLGISRTPVREALLELQKEGYVRFCRGKGIQIVAVDEKSIRDILEMRFYQESVAAELAARRADQTDLDNIVKCLEDGQRNLDSQVRDIIQWYRLDHQFHRAVARATHNEILYRTIDDVLNHYLRFEVLTVYQSSSSASAIWNEHKALYSAIQQRDPVRAHDAAQKHLHDAYLRTLGRYWSE